MKKINKTKLLILGAALTSVNLFAASIDHIQNYTAEYNANMAQQAAINPGTSPYFNPAGIMFLEDGTYVTGGVQIAFGKEMMKYQTKHDGENHEYKANLFAPIPDLAIIKKERDRAFFWTFGGIAGGGNLKYKNGVAGIKVLEDATLPLVMPNPKTGKLMPVLGKNADAGNSWAEGENMYAQTTIGTAWKINDKFSMSVGGRLVYGWRNLKANLDAKIDAYGMDGKKLAEGIPLPASMNAKRTAWGLGGQIGFDYKPNDVWNLALRYDTKVKLDFEADTKSENVKIGGKETPLGFGMFFPQYKDGAKYRRDLPAILALGATQQVTENWKMFYGFNYYFNESAKIDKDVKYGNLTKPGTVETGMEYKNGWEASLGSEYKLNEKFTLLGGVNYAHTGAPKESFNDVEFSLNSVLVGVGVKYKTENDSEWVVSTSHYIYEERSGNFAEKYNGANSQKYDKNISSIGISYTKKF